MKNTAFCSSTLSALQQITSIFDFVWPTYTALWNLRWQVQGYLDVTQTEGKKISPEELRRVFVTKEIHGENLLRLCSNDWSVQENLFSQILLAYAFSIYEGWICDLGNLLKWNRNQKKSLQFGSHENQKDENVIGAFVKSWKEKRSENDKLIGKVVYNTAKENKKYLKDSLEDLITCYRCFKEARNAFIHANGKATDSLKKAYREYSAKSKNIKTIMDEAPIFPDPSPDSSSMKEDFTLSLRGVVGFYNVIIVLIVTLDAELADSRYAERILCHRMATEPIKKRKNKTLKSNAISFHVRFCQATFVTFFQFSYIRSIIPLTHVTIGVVCCQNQNLVEYSVFVLQKTFSCISHRQRVSHRSQPSIDRERSRHSPIICHMRKTCEFEVSVLRCRMQSATRSFVELPLCSKISSLVLLKIRGEFLNLFCGIVQRPGSGTSRFTTSLCCNCFVYDSAFNSFVFNHISP